MGRILFVASTFSHIRNFHLPYLEAFVQQGWTVDVACGGTVMELPHVRRAYPIGLEKSMSSPKNFAAAHALRRLIRAQGYDLISCHTALASFFVRLAVMGMRRRPRVACICHGYLFDQDTPALKRTVLSAAEALTAPVTDLLLTMNQWDTQYAAAHKLGKKVAYIPGMGLDPDKLPPVSPQQGAQLREELGIPQDAFVLLFAGEFSHRKSQPVLLKALARLPQQVYLLLPGQGSELEACQGLARELGVEARVRFPGQVSDMPVWYAACDGVVSASRIEGLPFNLMEAMYYGLPIVASDVKGHHDLLAPQRAGLLYPYGDDDACAQQLGALLAQPQLRHALGATAQQAVVPYLLPTVLPQVMGQYQQLLDQGGIQTQ